MSKLLICFLTLFAPALWAQSPAAITAPPPAEALANVFALINGARTVSPEGELVEGKAPYAFDGDTQQDWEVDKRDAEPKNSLLLELPVAYDLFSLEFVNSMNEQGYPGISTKLIKVETAASIKGPWALTLKATLRQGQAPQRFAAQAKGIKYVRITILSNYGNKEWAAISEIRGLTRRARQLPVNFTGKWETGYGQMLLVQNGLRVTGCYGNPDHELAETKSGLNTVEGTLEGAIFAGTWRQEAETADQTSSGGIYFALNDKGDLTGVWNYTGEATLTKRWDGKKIQKAEIVCQKPEKTIANDLAAGRVVLRGILFDTGKDVIRAESLPTLEMLAAAMKKTAVNYLIEGHTDSQGGAEYNLGLSAQRAASVRVWLVGKGVAAARLKTIGFGLSKPVMPNDTEAGRAINRRVEVSANK